MDRMILPLFGALFLLLMGAGGMAFWDRHPPIGWHANLLIVHPGFSLPPSLAEQRDQAVTARNQAVAAMGQLQATSNARLADADQKVQAAQKATKDAMKSVDALLGYQPKGDDACQRAGDMQAWIQRDLAK